MGKLRLQCESCGEFMLGPAKAQGKKAKCIKCGFQTTIAPIQMYQFWTERGKTDWLTEWLAKQSISQAIITKDGYYRQEEQGEWQSCQSLKWASEEHAISPHPLDVVVYSEQFKRELCEYSTHGFDSIDEMLEQTDESRVIASYVVDTLDVRNGVAIRYWIEINRGEIQSGLTSYDGQRVDSCLDYKCQLERDGQNVYFPIPLLSYPEFGALGFCESALEHKNNTLRISFVADCNSQTKKTVFEICDAVINRVLASMVLHQSWRKIPVLSTIGPRAIDALKNYHASGGVPVSLVSETNRKAVFFDEDEVNNFVPSTTTHAVSLLPEFEDEVTDSNTTEGIVYILTNETMPNVVKIGKTARSVSKRITELNSTGVPSGFECFYAAFVDDMHDVERKLHKQLASSRVNDKREFFAVNPREAHKALAPFANGDATFT